MKKLRNLRDRLREDRGVALVWVGGMFVVLLMVSAFAVDLGWIYLHNSRLQSAADSAALAGVVNLPASPTQARTDATAAAGANGYPITGTTTLNDAVLAENEYQVFLEADVETFFLKVIGMDSFRLAQDATAQYIKPVRLGSPSNQFGGPGVNFWAAINGRFTEIQQGDPYASLCITHDGGSTPGCDGATNPDYRPEGYYYAVEIGPGSSGLNLQFYDGGHYIRTDTCYATGTSGPSDTSWRTCWNNLGVELEYVLFAPDTTPNDPTDNTNDLCSDKFPTIRDNGPSDPSWQVNAGHLNRWTGNNNCFLSGSLTPGIYVLQLPSPLYEGSSKFGVRANVSSGPAPKVYGILDMSIHVNFTGGVAEPYLAEVRPEHAGKTLEVDIWDLGDVNGSGDIQFIDPIGGLGNAPACTWDSSNGESSGLINDCFIDISNQRFNAEWLRVQLEIPSTYTCDPNSATGCWWKIHIESQNQPSDRTTWAARISGDPVRLID